jgi:hypothetical protein
VNDWTISSFKSFNIERRVENLEIPLPETHMPFSIIKNTLASWSAIPAAKLI